MRIRRAAEPQGDMINISSLLDVMFILIIFFLATATFDQEERDVQVLLPESASGETAADAPPVIVVNVRSDGSYYMDSREMEVDEMRNAVAAAHREHPRRKFLIRGDRRALHGHVAAAVLACRQAGVPEAHIGYQLPE